MAHAFKVKDQKDGKQCICFVTVSPTLRKKLAEKYEEVIELEEVALPPIQFYSLRELLSELVQYTRLGLDLSPRDRSMSECSFLEYINELSKKSHLGIAVDVREAENEICGVILGSLSAAKAGRHLTRDEYICERSYIKKDTDAGMKKRHEIYNVFEKYKKWKQANEKFDLSDSVLELIKKLRGGRSGSAWVQLFISVYLDEIQDFSYASIYLICHIAGYNNLHWVMAG